jgi:Na+/proline symporter
MKSGKMPEVPGSQAYAAVVGQFMPPWYGILFIWLVLSATVGSVGAAMVAIGNIVGNDIYRTYFNQTATDDQVKKVVRTVVAIATVCVIVIALMPLSILMVLLFMPMYCAPFVWGFIRSQYNKNLSSGPILAGGIIGFIVGTYMFLGMNMWGWAMIVAFATAGLISEIGSAIAPANFDFAKLKTVKAR